MHKSHILIILISLIELGGLIQPKAAFAGSQDDVAQVILMSAELQKSIPDRFLEIASSIDPSRQNVSAESELIAPNRSNGGPFIASIVTAVVASADADSTGITVVDYNPGYDVGWIFHYAPAENGTLKTHDGKSYKLDGWITVTGGMLRGAGLSEAGPHWLEAKDYSLMTTDYATIRAKHWTFDSLLAIGGAELLRQRHWVDLHVMTLVQEQAQAGSAGNSPEQFPSLTLADAVLACGRDTDIGRVHNCLSSSPFLKGATAQWPDDINSEGYELLWASIYFMGTVVLTGDRRDVLFAGTVPFENKYVLVVAMEGALAKNIMFIPIGQN